MPRLLLKNSTDSADVYPLTRLKTTIGRSARSDICIPDAFASRLHAEVRKEGDAFFLHDLGSANGTRFNGRLVSVPMPISNGDEIRIGETVFNFEDDSISRNISATLIADSTAALDPQKTIALSRDQMPTSDILESQFSDRRELLGIISKVGIALLSSSGLDETIKQVASLVFEAVPAERCVIMLRDDNEEGGMKILAARTRDKEEQIEEVRISRTVLKEVLENGKSVLTSDAQHDPRFASQTMVLLGIRSVLAVPLSVDGREVFGIVYADSPTDETTFSEEHLEILRTLASVAAIRLQNARLLEERFERERMERELEVAIEIQQRFQPSAAPKIAGYEFVGISFACYEIGGDYYDFIPLHNGKMLIALGDVSGKGTAAALLMSSLHAALHAQVVTKIELSEMISAVNNYMAETTPSNRFITLFTAELQAEEGSLKFINAGHNPPLIVRADGSVEQLESGGFPLGIIPNADYDVGNAVLNSGESLIIYSDGVTEAENADCEEFGIEKLSDVLAQNHQKSASGMRDRIESALSTFTKSAPAGDDITLVIVKRI